MKRRELVKKLEDAGFTLARHGGNHDIYIRGTVTESIGRHPDIPERLARDILRRNKIK